MNRPNSFVDIFRFPFSLGMMYTSDVQIPTDMKTAGRNGRVFIEWE